MVVRGWTSFKGHGKYLEGLRLLVADFGGTHVKPEASDLYAVWSVSFGYSVFVSLQAGQDTAFFPWGDYHSNILVGKILDHLHQGRLAVAVVFQVENSPQRVRTDLECSVLGKYCLVFEHCALRQQKRFFGGVRRPKSFQDFILTNSVLISVCY